MKIVPSINSFGITDVGLVREKNEDVYAICQEDLLYVLADGMGGHRAGDVAAQAAVNGLCAILKDAIDHSETALTPQEFGNRLKSAFEEVNRITYRLGTQEPYLKGMGTTLLCVHLIKGYAVLGHIGDSRIYRFRKGTLKQMTQDHSLLRELMDMGQISEEESEHFMYKNILTRAVGTEPTVEPTIRIEKLEKGDVYLLCSDGLTDHLSPEDIENVFKKQKTVEKVGKACVRLAKERGGHDNITMLLVEFEGP